MQTLGAYCRDLSTRLRRGPDDWQRELVIRYDKVDVAAWVCMGPTDTMIAIFWSMFVFFSTFESVVTQPLFELLKYFCVSLKLFLNYNVFLFHYLPRK